ncbi:LysR family transcriptional regulator [Piscinibacter sp. XHJ-5]|uniref:LysR family transcriptional regulator n=1 Tax=Piscinibacter sp. XHJ-5 TaxID=3037797 RepID=UPI002452CE83|nr:LysR family transcriptional regulator [Piscinibacter sp. XHJ-5]
MDRLTSARVFVEVADRASLTQAAERLGMSPAMVSRHLAAAEEWLGSRLLHRTTRRVSLTDAGQAAMVSCRQLLELAQEMQHRAGDRSREPDGTLRITTSPSFAEAQLTAALVDFQRHHQRVRVDLLVVDRAVDLVEDRIDLAVRISNTLDPGLVSRALTQCRSVLCAAPSYLARHGHPGTADELKTHPCIGHAFGSGTTYRLTRAGRAIEIPVSGSLFTNETAILRRAVLAGAGIGMLPTYFVTEQLRRGELVQLLPDHEPEVLGIHAVYLSRRHQPLALRLLVDFLAARFGGATAPWDAPPGKRVPR